MSESCLLQCVEKWCNGEHAALEERAVTGSSPVLLYLFLEVWCNVEHSRLAKAKRSRVRVPCTSTLYYGDVV
jgi:hypothetical protein